MARKKALIEPISNPAARRTTFKKRKASLLKKAQELSTLCDVEACVIVSEGPHDPNPEMWPPRQDAMQILAHFNAMSEDDKGKKMLDRVGYLSQQLEKVHAQVRKVESENCELETAMLLHMVLSGQSGIADVASFQALLDLEAMVERRLGEVGRRVNELASAPELPSFRHFDMWAPPAVVSDQAAFCLTAEVASVQLFNGTDEGAKDGDVDSVMVGSQVREDDEFDSFFNYSAFDFWCT